MRERHILLALAALALLTLWLGFLTYYALTSTEQVLQRAAPAADVAAAQPPQVDYEAQARLLRLQVALLERRALHTAVAEGDAAGPNAEVGAPAGEQPRKGSGAGLRPAAASHHEAELMQRIATLTEKLRLSAGRSADIEAELNATHRKLEICQKAAQYRAKHGGETRQQAAGPAQQPSPEPPARAGTTDLPAAMARRYHSARVLVPPRAQHRRSREGGGSGSGGINDTPPPVGGGGRGLQLDGDSLVRGRRRRKPSRREPDPEDFGRVDDPAIPEEPAFTDYPPEPPPVGVNASDPAFDPRHPYEIPVVIFAYNRPLVLKKCIKTVLARMPKTGFRLFVSQDSWQFPEVTKLIESYAKQGVLTHLIHRRNDSGANAVERQNNWQPYFAIAHHYEFAMSQIFGISRYDRLILLEDDLEVGVDFFAYMAATSKLLDEDPSLYCVSAWNDNGKAQLIADPTQLYRTDFFPGLGWMLSREVWEELQPRWPRGFWDDWMRQPDKRRGRSCIRPEVPRSFTWCSDEGVSQGQFCAEHLEEIKLIDKPVDWEAQSLGYLLHDPYEDWLDGVLKRASVAHSAEEVARLQGSEEVKIFYRSKQHFRQLAGTFQLMDDFKDGVPRTAYRGIVSFRFLHHRVHLVSDAELYD